MTRAATLVAARFGCLRISPKTVWVLVELDASDGCTGCGEATLQGQHEAVAAAARRTLPLLMRRDATPRALASLGLDESLLAQAALLSALDMALFDLAGQADGVPVHALLGGAQRAQVPLYANINRFSSYLRAGAYDVIMPDVKYLGGLARFRELATLAAECGAVMSPHNPTGPVCHAASVHVAATLPTLDSLEVQFDETHQFEALVAAAPVTQASDGQVETPAVPGLGVALQPALVERLRISESSFSCGG